MLWETGPLRQALSEVPRRQHHQVQHLRSRRTGEVTLALNLPAPSTMLPALAAVWRMDCSRLRGCRGRSGLATLLTASSTACTHVPQV